MVELLVNGHGYELAAPVGRTLAEALRLDPGLTGTKVACGEGHCGACPGQLGGGPGLPGITLPPPVGGPGGQTGPGGVARRPARRVDGHGRARGQATSTGDVPRPGMLPAAVVRSPHAGARVKNLDLTKARETPWVRGAIGPDDCHVLEREPS